MAVLPPPPKASYMESMDVSIAKAIEKLAPLVGDSILEMMGAISEEDANNYQILLAMHESLNLPFLKNYVYKGLALSGSIIDKKDGRRAMLLGEVVKQPPMMQQPLGFWGGLRNRIRGQ